MMGIELDTMGYSYQTTIGFNRMLVSWYSLGVFEIGRYDVLLLKEPREGHENPPELSALHRMDWRYAIAEPTM